LGPTLFDGSLVLAAACGVLLAAHYLRSSRILLPLVIGGALLAGSTIAVYFVTMRQLAQNHVLSSYWTRIGAYPPCTPRCRSTRSARTTAFSVLSNPGVNILPLHGVRELMGAIALTLIALTAGYSVTTGVDKAVHPDETASSREALRFIAVHRQPGDLVYSDRWAISALQFYGPKYRITADGSFEFENQVCLDDPFKPLIGHRVWLYFGYRPGDQPLDRAKVYLTHFEQEGSLIRSYTGLGGAGAYLLDFSDRPREAVRALPTWLEGSCLLVSPQAIS
jgi:hypothetical protein